MQVEKGDFMDKYVEFTLENGVNAVKIENIPYIEFQLYLYHTQFHFS